MAIPTASDNEFPKVILEEVADDGSATVTPAADHRALFLGEDGLLHLKDSAGAVSTPGAGSSPGLTRVHRATNQTLNNNTLTAISWSHEQWDDDGMWVVGTPTRLTCQTTGIYVVSCTILWSSSSAAGTSRQLRLHVNGSGLSIAMCQPATPAGITLTDQIKLTATDYIEWIAFQDRGGTLDLDSNAGVTLFASALRIA
jgi:hypothetical protein